MKKANVSVSINCISSGNVQILLEGQLIINNAKAIKSKLLKALSKAQNLELVFRNVIKLDLAVLQLLIALQKSAPSLEKIISFDMEPTDYIKSVLHNSGLQNILAQNFKKAV